MAASVASATCCHGTRRPTGSARGAGGRPRGQEPAASSNSRRVTSWTGWPISCRRRGSTGIARRFETSQGCSPRITSSGPPSRPMTKGNVGKPRDAATHGHAVGGHAARGDATGDRCDSCDKPPSFDTSRRQRPNSWRGWGRSFLLRALGCGGDIRLIAPITEPWTIRKMLSRLGEPLEPPLIAKKERPGFPKPLFLHPTSHYPAHARQAAR